MSDRLVGRYRMPHIKGQPSQAHAARQSIKKLTADTTERAVLGVIIEHANGAGVCYPKVERIAVLSGYCVRHVQRVTARLIEAGLLEVYRSLRDPDAYDPNLPQHARQGNGPNYYRLGATVRAAAGYRDVDMGDVYGGAPFAPQIPSVSPPDRREGDSGTPSAEDPPLVTPDLVAAHSLSVQGNQSRRRLRHVTPRTENWKPSMMQAGELETSTRDPGDREAERDLADELLLSVRHSLSATQLAETAASLRAWSDDELDDVAALPLSEQATVLLLVALLDARPVPNGGNP